MIIILNTQTIKKINEKLIRMDQDSHNIKVRRDRLV